MTTAYEEIIDFLVSGNGPEQFAAFQPSEESRTRFWLLVEREKERSLTPDEASELETYLQIEHIMRLAKGRARQILSQNFQIASSG